MNPDRTTRPRPTPAPVLPAVSAAPARATWTEPAAVFVPDFQGVSLAHARALAARESLRLHVEGTPTGLVVHQTPAPGTIMEGGDRTVILSVKRAGGKS